MKRTQKLLCMGLFSKELSGPLLTGQPGGVRRYPGYRPAHLLENSVCCAGTDSKVPVLPGSRLGTVSDAVFDDTGGVEPGLKRYLGDTWQIVIVHHVADYEHLRVPGYR